jgi:tetratricopeptide (TPR) repeat protein
MKIPMRKHIVIALILLAVGLGVSFALIPGDSRVVGGAPGGSTAPAVDLSGVDVEAAYKNGDRSLAIVLALAEKRVAGGDRQGAITVLEAYVAERPTDISARNKLAEQYQLAGNRDAYNTQLEAIANAEPNEANLRILSDIYNADKEYVKQVEILKKLLEVTGGARPEAFVDLATIQVVISDSEGALATVEALNKKHPQFSSYPMTRIMVSLRAERGDGEQALTAAKQWMEQPQAPVPQANPATPAVPPVAGAAPVAAAAAATGKAAELADLCNILHYSGHADKAVALVDAYPGYIENTPDVVTAYVNANITAGRADHAYATLKQVDDAGKLIAAHYPPYLNLALTREDMEAANTIAAKANPAIFTEDASLNLFEVVRQHRQADILEALAARFGELAYLQDKPVLAAVLAMLRNQPDQDTTIEAALQSPLSPTQRIRLAESCARANKAACFDTIIAQYPERDQQSASQVAERAQLFIIAERAKEEVDPVGALAAAPQAAVIVQIAHRKLAAAAGRADVLSPWLEANANKVSIAHLQELFYLANDRGHGAIASDIAERLFARDPSPMNRGLMVSAFLGAGLYEKALPLLREQVSDANASDALYVSTLSKLARKNADYRKELVAHAQAALDAKRGDDRAQLNYAYVLINHGARQAVMPYAKAYATERGGEWKKMHAQLTQKTGAAGAPAKKLSREELLQMAGNPSLPQARKREIAFTLLNDGHKADALTLFTALAQDKSPDSEEVKDLLYLWGGKLDTQQLAWVKARAASASPYDKQRWENLILKSADDKTILSYVSATPDALYNPELRMEYFRVLAASGSRAHYENAMGDWVNQTTDIPALLDYATVGNNSGFTQAAVQGYSRVLSLDPNNAKALKQMAALDFSKGKYTSADEKLGRLQAVDQQQPQTPSDSAEAHFYRAQLLRRQGKRDAAAQEFQQVITKTSQSGASAPDALSRLYTSQFHLGQHADAKQGFNQLLQQYPDNKGLLADYMSALIEYNYLDEATSIANQYDKTSPYYGRGASLVGRSALVAHVEALNAGRSMKLHFSQPIGDAPPVDLAAARQLGWHEESSLGHDSLSISARPGYTLRYLPTSQDNFAVVATPAPNYAPQVEQQRQQDLRLQLLYAQIEQQSGQADRARQRINALKVYYPEDSQLLSLEASIASASGQRQQAIELIQHAKALAPENEALTFQAQNIRRTGLGNHIKLDQHYRGLGDNDEHITTLSTEVSPSQQSFVGAVLQRNHLKTDDFRAARTGNLTRFKGERHRGELYAGYTYDDGSRAKASLFANDADVGAGLSFAFNNALGRTELIGEYQRPYWDFIEATYEDATRSRVGFKHFTALQPTTTLGVESSYNSYNIDGFSGESGKDVAQTALLRLNLVQEIQPETSTQPYLGVGYGFDGEYRTEKPESRLNGLGQRYYLLPVRSREVHALTGIYRDHWTPETEVLFVGGVAYDRMSRAFSPLAEGRIDHDLDAQWQVGARARYAQETNNTDNQALDVGADILYKF